MKKVLIYLTGLLLLNTGFGQLQVWPGDANNNGAATNFDLFYVGLGFGLTGPARNFVSTQWTGFQVSQAWNTSSPATGTNYVYADCDGSGLIDADDAAAIRLNYGLTHGTVVPDTLPPGGSGLSMSYVFPADSFAAGSIDTVDIVVNVSGLLVNLYGLAWTVTFDTSLIDSMYPIFDSSQLAMPAEILLDVSQYDRPNGRLNLGLCRTNQTPVTISGVVKVGSVGIVMVDNLKTHATSAMLNLGLTDLVAMDHQEQFSGVDAAGDSILIYTGLVEARPAPPPSLRIFAQGDWLRIVAEQAPVERVELFGISGRLAGDYTFPREASARIPFSGLSKGLYFVRIHTVQGIVTHKIMKY